MLDLIGYWSVLTFLSMLLFFPFVLAIVGLGKIAIVDLTNGDVGKTQLHRKISFFDFYDIEDRIDKMSPRKHPRIFSFQFHPNYSNLFLVLSVVLWLAMFIRLGYEEYIAESFTSVIIDTINTISINLANHGIGTLLFMFVSYAVARIGIKRSYVVYKKIKRLSNLHDDT